MGCSDAFNDHRWASRARLCTLMWRYAKSTLTSGTIRKVQRKAISIDKFYIIRLEQAKEHGIGMARDAAGPTPKSSFVRDMDASDLGEDEDLGVSIAEDDADVPLHEDDTGAPVADDQDDAASFEDSMDESEDGWKVERVKVSDECQKILDKSRDEIMKITQ